ncbi:hypothetical protein JYU34_012411, partial [Plutella xylostella]
EGARRAGGHELRDGVLVYRERTSSRESSVSRSSSTTGSRDGSPRPRAEDIPLEDIKRAAPAPLAQPSTSAAPPRATHSSSEETSFISADPPRVKRKGLVETI